MIAIAGGKGGCGKTTTTVALARALARRLDATPLAADADWDMPNLHALAGVAPTPSLAALPGDASPRALAQSVGDPRIDVLPAPTGDGTADERSPSNSRSHARRDAGRALGALRAGVGPSPALVDCPAGAGRDAARPLRVADAVVLVSTRATESLRDAAKTAAMAEALGTPVIGGALTRTARVPEGAEQLLGTERLVPIPDAANPLDDPDVRLASDDLADLVAERGRRSARGVGRPRDDERSRDVDRARGARRASRDRARSSRRAVRKRRPGPGRAPSDGN